MLPSSIVSPLHSSSNPTFIFAARRRADRDSVHSRESTHTHATVKHTYMCYKRHISTHTHTHMGMDMVDMDLYMFTYVWECPGVGAGASGVVIAGRGHAAAIHHEWGRYGIRHEWGRYGGAPSRATHCFHCHRCRAD